MAAVSLAAAALVGARAEPIVMASTTSTEQSGLFAHLLPAFTKATGVEVKVVALGTGQACKVWNSHSPGSLCSTISGGCGPAPARGTT